MFKLRRRTVAATTGSDLPFCSMCGQNIRVDNASGRCALGHRVAAPGTLAPAVATADEMTAILEPVSADPTVALETFDEFQPAPVAAYDDRSSGYAGEGLYEAYQTADAASGHSVTWDDVVSPGDSGVVYDDYLAWDGPANGFSSLDVDTEVLPVAADETDEDASPAATITPVSSDLLDELDEAAYARRKAVGTIGATIGITSVAFAALAVLPF